jgi:hypothetical protein
MVIAGQPPARRRAPGRISWHWFDIRLDFGGTASIAVPAEGEE